MSPRSTRTGSGARSSGRWLLALLGALVVLVGSAFPLPAGDRRTFGLDKVLHVVGHCLSATTLTAALDPDRTRDPARVVVSVVASVGYVAVLERLQESVPGRRYERGDVLAGVLGVFVGVLWYYRHGRRPGW